MNEVLIVSYSLSTSKGVGGRRWAKFIQELSKKHKVHVVSVLGEFNPNEFNKNIVIEGVVGNYPAILDEMPRNFIDKIRYRIALKMLRFLVKGTVYDRGARLQSKLQSKIAEKLENGNIKNVIVSGAPFSFLYYVTILKEKFPGVNFIADFRDPWTWGQGYGMQTLSEKRLSLEKSREQYVLKNADFILGASHDICVVLNEKLKKFDKESILLLNGIEKGVSVLQNTKSFANEISITHIGSVNKGTEKYWKNFVKYVINSSLTIKVKFIGNNNKSLEVDIRKMNVDSFVFIERVDEKEIQKHIADTDFLLMFKHDSFPNSFPSKFFDYIKSRKPIICYTLQGLVSQEIANNNIGLVFTENISDKEIDQVFIKYCNDELVFNKEYDWQKYSIEERVKNIESLFNYF